MPRQKHPAHPTPPRRWDERAVLDGPSRWHTLLRFVMLWAILHRPREELADLKEVVLDAHSTPDRRREAEAMWDHIEGTLTGWALEEGAVRAYQTVLPTLLKQRFGKVPAKVARRIEATTDPERLRACIEAVLKMDSLDDLPL
jgi:hypothetical protein